MTASPYGAEFYRAIREGSRRTASVVVPLIVELLGPVGSVVDVGCGTAQWLAEFGDYGVGDLLGLDGPYVDPGWLAIPEEQFRPTDLSDPPPLGRQFDVALCIEVAEHLPISTADRFVHYLTEIGKVIVFSAAIPFQGGREHVNEQWPSYWVDKFASYGYVGLDPFRRHIWNDRRVEEWVAQNLLAFVPEARIESDERLAAEKGWCGGQPLPLVHPSLYLPKAKVAKRALDLYRRPPVLAARRALRRLGIRPPS